MGCLCLAILMTYVTSFDLIERMMIRRLSVHPVLCPAENSAEKSLGAID